MNRLAGKIALITGASGGMGAEEARLMASHGACVVLGDVVDDQGEATARSIAASGARAEYIHLDVTDEAQWANAIDRVRDRYGRLDVLVNNAGIYSGKEGLIAEYSQQDWDWVIAVNATGVFLGTLHGARAMRPGGGSIVNVSSIYGLVGAPSEAPYPASKGAVRSFSKAAAVALAPERIRVNSLHPGFIDTPQSAGLIDDPVERAKLVDRTPVGRIGTPRDVAWGVLYLASDESAYMTGAEFVIDGGITAR